MMLNAWHLPVPPFVKQSKDQLLITLWLTGEDPPQRIMLRTEHDNEEMSVPMHKQRSQPQPGVTAWRAAIDLSSGQPRRRYSFKLLWHDRQRWFTPQGFSRMPPARLEQFAVDVPDIDPQWAADQIFYQIFPDRFARSLPREAEQDHVYYHHAAGQEIILRDWDEPVTAQAGGSTFYGGDLDGKDLSKADVSVNIYAFLKAQETGKSVTLCCAVGDSTVDGRPYSEIVEIARNYIRSVGGFEKFAEWGLV